MKDRKLPRKAIAIAAGLALLLAIAATVSWMHLRADQPAILAIPISDALDLVERRQIAEAVLSGNSLMLTDRQGMRYIAMKEEGQSLVETLRRNGVSVSVTGAQPSPWPAAGFALVLVALLGALVFFGSRNGANGQAFSFGRSRARRWSDHMTDVTFSDVAGVDEAKQELEEVVQYLKSPEKFRALGARIPHGLLLAGPPGSGKTLLSKAVAGEASVPFFSISGSEFVEMFVGVGASRVRDLFRQARRSAPCIIFIDEIDAVGRHRSSHPAGANEERDQTLNQLLVEMDGFDSNASTIVIAATNRPDILDPALLRPGRFDRQVTLDAPDVRGRTAILQVHGRGKPLAADVDLAVLAAQTPGFSGADLANLINEAALLAARRSHTEIGMVDLEEAILRVMAGPERKSRIISEEERRIIAYHEVGHALVMKRVPHADPVHKVSIISRGRALGLTVQRPKEDRYLLTTGHLKARLAAAMGGRVAEELVFGDFTTGAAQDIDYASSLARRMVGELGMSELGNIHLGRREAPEQVSEAMAARVDAEVCRLVDDAYATARSILTANRRALDHVAKHLIQVETLSGDEMDTQLAACADPAERLLEQLDLPTAPDPEFPGATIPV